MAHCDRFIGWRPRPDGWGNEAIQCHTTIGLTSWTDSTGQRRWACARHRASLERRYPEMTEAEARVMDGNR